MSTFSNFNSNSINHLSTTYITINLPITISIDKPGKT